VTIARSQIQVHVLKIGTEVQLKYNYHVQQVYQLDISQNNFTASERS